MQDLYTISSTTRVRSRVNFKQGSWAYWAGRMWASGLGFRGLGVLGLGFSLLG